MKDATGKKLKYGMKDAQSLAERLIASGEASNELKEAYKAIKSGNHAHVITEHKERSKEWKKVMKREQTKARVRKYRENKKMENAK